ncbi:MAG: hypothetical protein Q7J12_00165 [Syntrophales bacterium]|nr:hypothetical protein [Syntrophales bacterium]
MIDTINRRGGWLRRAWDMGIIHSVAEMIILALIVALIIVMAGIYQPEPPRINDRAPALEKIMEVTE